MENSADFVRPAIILGGIAIAVIFPVALVFFIYRNGKKNARATSEKRAQTELSALPARARIVDLRRAEVQRSQEYTLFKLLLEVPPPNAVPFSAAVVWEIEAPAIGAIERGGVLPVTFNPQNAREVFPDTPHARYSYQYRHAYLGIEDDFQTAQAAAAPQIAPEAPKENTIFRKRSATRIFGLPLWEVAFNLVHQKGRVRYAKPARARAVFAVGDHATGLVAIGSFARGLIAVGQSAFGVAAFGAGALGIFSFGLLSLGAIAVGMLSGGLLSVGAIAGGWASVGLLTASRYELSPEAQSPQMLTIYESFRNLLGTSDAAVKTTVESGSVVVVVAGFAIFILSFVALALAGNFLKPNDNRLASPRN